jgi:sterol desaturase/sphingolipid hydroxylase (fatty acid hydroxylase superfamily)
MSHERTTERSEPAGARASLWPLVAAAGVALLLWTERRRSLRDPSAALEGHRGERLATNLAMASLSAGAAHVAMTPVVEPLSRRVERQRASLVQRLPGPAWLRDAIAVVLLDYTLYWWHVLEHRASWLYRFHQVHHADLALDATTALRFHFGEFLASVPWRAAQVAVIGASPRAMRAWQRLTVLSVLFHHSSVRLPLWLERRLARVVMTPRLHGIHHSVVVSEQDSNWSSGLTLWDRLHGTYRANVPQDGIEIGVAAYRQPRDVTLPRSLAMPLEPPPPARFPDGRVPTRADAPVAHNVMLG